MLPLIVGLLVGLVAGFGVGFVAAFAPHLAGPDEPSNPASDAPPPVPVRGGILGRGPHDGYVLVLEPGHLNLEIVHNEHWGIVGAYPLDVNDDLIELATPPVLGVYMDEESYLVEAVRENWDGDEDGGWHFEHDGLLGVPEAARFRVHWNDRVYTPPCRHVHLHDDEGPGHAHAAAADVADPEE